GNADWGCSSICEFNNNLERTWPGRTDFRVTDQVTVDVIQLADFIKEHGIKTIDYLHVDAQGQDLEVLMGLCEYINIVKRGQIEMPTSHTSKLYKNQRYIKDDAIRFLEEHGFTINGVYSNDAQGNEVNIQFTKQLQ
ncbi:FkbM family methyltransferase, partial [bacterium]|nr:FkbM family methyltransferase [bacterium]